MPGEQGLPRPEPGRLRALVEGALHALEVHSGVALTMLDGHGGVAAARQTLAEAAVPDVTALLATAVGMALLRRLRPRRDVTGPSAPGR